MLLQKLEDKGRSKLTLAGIPLLSPQQTESTDGPRLIFTFTLNRLPENDAAIIVAGKLHQRVKLWREPSQEMDAVTWKQSGFGYPTVKVDVVFQLFDTVLNDFIRAYTTANPHATAVTQDSGSVASTLVKETEESLKGLKGIRVFVNIGPHHLDKTLWQNLEKTLRSEAERRIKEAGIPLLYYADEVEAAGSPLLRVDFKLVAPGFTAYSPAIQAGTKFLQKVRLARDPQRKIDVVTWETGTGAGPTVTDEAVLNVLHSQLDEFLKAYRTVNSTAASARK